MPLTVNGPQKRATRYLISALSALLPIGLGILILHWQAERTLQQSTPRRWPRKRCASST
ncbi:MAG: hypothetical protein LKM38_23830 [Pseudomonas veronii]|jgi:hypothetical protein|nr:hypothetical protein [Pseudomonas veronii]